MDKDHKIDVGPSSLVALRAELHRKQEESRKIRPSDDAVPKRMKKLPPAESANKGVQERDARDREQEPEEVKDLEKSRLVLEAKSQLYEQLEKRGLDADDEQDERFLVNFQQKAVDKVRAQKSRQENSDADNGALEGEEYQSRGPDDDWVQFTDSLGRSRTVMRRDLAEYRRRDQESRRDAAAERDAPPRDDALRRQHDLWQQQELANEGARDVHYQNVLFDEARTHGAGYFAFSGEAAERARQQEQLEQLRRHTQQQQTRTGEEKKRSKQKLQERLRKVRERKRLKLGLPIEDHMEKEYAVENDEEEEKVEPVEPTEQEKRIAEEQEKRKAERERLVREWDHGKEGVRDKPLLSQQEWVEKQREERKAEFAPPKIYASSHSSAAKARKPNRRIDDSTSRIEPVVSPGSSLTDTSSGFGKSMPTMPTSQMSEIRRGNPPSTGHGSVPTPAPDYTVPPPAMTGTNNYVAPHVFSQPPPNYPQPPPNYPSPANQHHHTVDISRTSLTSQTHPMHTGNAYRNQANTSHSNSYSQSSFKRRATASVSATESDGDESATYTDHRGVRTEVAPPMSAEYFGGGYKRSRVSKKGTSGADMGSAIEAGMAMLSEDVKIKQDRTFNL